MAEKAACEFGRISSDQLFAKATGPLRVSAILASPISHSCLIVQQMYKSKPYNDEKESGGATEKLDQTSDARLDLWRIWGEYGVRWRVTRPKGLLCRSYRSLWKIMVRRGLYQARCLPRDNKKM